MSGLRSFQAGLCAEETALRAYQRAGLSLLARRWRGPGGEIDLILADGPAMVFVEVKAARTLDRAAAALGPRQMARIRASAAAWLGTRPAGLDTEARFDVALVDAGGAIRILHNVQSD